jgi:hypothetical protein
MNTDIILMLKPNKNIYKPKLDNYLMKIMIYKDSD